MSGSGRVLAVDLGATSIRVAAVDLAAAEPTVEIVHRWAHAPVAHPDGSLRWDWRRIVAEVEAGLERGVAAGPVASIGVDGWGVDYGLVDRAGELVAPPYSYRDGRTAGWRRTADAVGLGHIYGITGIQIMPINTIFQLACHDRSELDRASRLLLLPDLLVRDLTGFDGAERSNASTTGLLDASTGDWSAELVDAIALDRALLPQVVSAKLRAGTWRGIPVHLVGSHDTASAFVAMPGGSVPGTVFVSAGTWVIVGVERPAPDTSEEARAANFSNEAGALGGVGFLRNVTGFWILERCRHAWGDPPTEELIDEAADIQGGVPEFDAGDDRFLAPADMEGEVLTAAGLPTGTPRPVVVRSILASIGAGIAAVVDDLNAVTDVVPARIAVVGGGAHVTLLHEHMAERTGLPVVRGSSEATALGNAIVQGIALGRFGGLDHGRKWLAATGELA